MTTPTTNDPQQQQPGSAWTCAAGHDVTGHQNVVQLFRDEVLDAEWLLCDWHADIVEKAVAEAMSK